MSVAKLQASVVKECGPRGGDLGYRGQVTDASGRLLWESSRLHRHQRTALAEAVAALDALACWQALSPWERARLAGRLRGVWHWDVRG